MNLRNVVEGMIETAQGAGKLILNRESIDVQEKGDVSNIVTSMDIKSQEYILARLTKLLPEAKVIAEESTNNEFDNGYVWCVDPIDGTTNYAYDAKMSCISIALLKEGKGYIGVVYNPYSDETFVGVKGHGAYLNGKAIHVNTYPLSASLISVGTTPYNKEMADITFEKMKNIFKHCRDTRRSGSATIDMCYVACGRYDGYYEYVLAPWDYAAVATIIEEAGGVINTADPFTWGYTKSITIIAGTKTNFDELKKIVTEI